MSAQSIETMIDEALYAHLMKFISDEFDPDAQIAWPNLAFKPPVDASGKQKVYFTVNNLPAETVPGAFGYHAPNLHRGVLVINVLYPENVGLTKPGDLVGALIAHFKRGTAMVSDEVVVHVDGPPWKSPPLQPPQQYQIPVNIRWYCYAPNPD